MSEEIDEAEEEDWLTESVEKARKPEPSRPDYQRAMLPCDACQ